jgi:hypothetical protein
MPVVYRRGGDLVGELNRMTKNIKLPFQKFEGEMHLPGMNYAGPGTRLDLRLNDDGTPTTWSMPVDRVDLAAYHHDMSYAAHSDTANRNAADRAMLSELDSISDPTARERIERAIIKPIISTKRRFGLGVKPANFRKAAFNRGLSEVRPAALNDEHEVRWTDKLADELHKPVRRHFRKRRVLVRGIDAVWAVDLIDMQHYAKDNDNFKFILAVIDVFSKFGWMRALKNKTGGEVAHALNDIITTSGRRPLQTWCDKGTEFYNKLVKNLADLISSENEQKSSVVERENSTMKQRMFKYFTANNTRRYVDVLNDMMSQYNNTKHSSV